MRWQETCLNLRQELWSPQLTSKHLYHPWLHCLEVLKDGLHMSLALIQGKPGPRWKSCCGCLHSLLSICDCAVSDASAHLSGIGVKDINEALRVSGQDLAWDALKIIYTSSSRPKGGANLEDALLSAGLLQNLDNNALMPESSVHMHIKWCPYRLEGAVFENSRKFKIFAANSFEKFRKLSRMFENVCPPSFRGGGEFSNMFENFAVSISSGPEMGFSKIFEKKNRKIAPPSIRGGEGFSKIFESFAVSTSSGRS